MKQQTWKPDPIRWTFLAGGGIVGSSLGAYALQFSTGAIWLANLVIASLLLAVGLCLSLASIAIAVRRRRHVMLTINLTTYWLTAWIGLLLLAFHDDSLAYVATLVAAIVSVLVSWGMVTFVPPGNAKVRDSGWWHIRNSRRKFS